MHCFIEIANKMKQILPENYKPKLDFFQTEKGIKLVKDIFEQKLSQYLSLQRVSAPRFLEIGNGLQDDLAGTQEPVGFHVKHNSKRLEMVHSLAKWKRYTLGKHGFNPGTGLYTDMDAVRKDEIVDNTHSIYVDQWDWEKVITEKDRTLKYLKDTVREIYKALLDAEEIVEKEFPQLKKKLPKKLRFLHTQDLENLYSKLSTEERENEVAWKYKAYFLGGIGGKLKSGKIHDIRAADYDDWITETEDGRKGLNGDIIVYDEMREKALELSSMGIRVDKTSLIQQLREMNLEDRTELPFHQGILNDTMPLSIGGGIGQSRICMLLLQKAHIGEVQSSDWPDDVVEEFEKRNIPLL